LKDILELRNSDIEKLTEEFQNKNNELKALETLHKSDIKQLELRNNEVIDLQSRLTEAKEYESELAEKYKVVNDSM
jgi:flagellar motility protein MotE (MotC chaperone)